MTTYMAPICTGCTHYRGQRGDEFTCDAFPKGIPVSIIHSRDDHRKPVAGDHGIQFEPTDAEAAQYAADLFALIATSGSR